ncbi:MAG TPA: galactokinase family protein [Gemmatimonas sp.]|uniref:galactokinase n=1 Tax=Gemmatimonas sp. TaxID=1962908 RepID=UPI002ED8E620
MGGRAILDAYPLPDAPLSPEAAKAAEQLWRDAHLALDRVDVPRRDRRTWLVPGRIEVLGKHVDYAGGRSLLCAVERALVVVARPRDDAMVVIRDARRRETVSMAIGHPQRGSIPWSVYPRTTVSRLMRNFGGAVRGADIAIASNLPPAAGVSSSSALTVGLTVAMASVADLTQDARWTRAITDRLSLAGYVGALENGGDFAGLGGERGVGTMGGAQDQTAILCCAPGQLDVFRWIPAAHEQTVPWPDGHRFVIAVSGVVAAKTGAARERYNRVARTAHRLVQAWNRHTGDDVRTLHGAFMAAAGGGVPTDVPRALMTAAELAVDPDFSAHHFRARLEQFFEEAFVLVPKAADALRSSDLSAFGSLVDASQFGAERALENQIAETVHLHRYARDLGADAASAFGAGFGGSVWAMIPAAQADAFMARWRERYVRAHPVAAQRSQFFVTAPSASAFELVD